VLFVGVGRDGWGVGVGVREFCRGNLRRCAGNWVPECDGQVRACEAAVQLSFLLRPVVQPNALPHSDLPMLRSVTGCPAMRFSWASEEAATRHRARPVVSNVTGEMLGEQEIEPDPRVRIALRELDHAGGKAVCVSLFDAALLASLAEMAQANDAFEKDLGQLHALQVVLNSMRPSSTLTQARWRRSRMRERLEDLHSQPIGARVTCEGRRARRAAPPRDGTTATGGMDVDTMPGNGG